MALVIKYFPPDYSSLQDDLIYTVSETVKTADPVTYPNYKFIGDVYVGGVLVARMKKVQDPITGIGIFNIGQVVRNYLQTIFDPTANVLVAQIMGAYIHNLPIQMKFGEEYSATSYLNITVDTQRTFFNNYNGRLTSGYSSLLPYTDKVASSRPLTGETFLTSQNVFLPFLPTTTADIPVIITPDIGSVYSTTYTPANALNLLIFNVSPQALNSAHPGTIVAATTYYIVQIGASTYHFNIICEPIYTPYTVHFLNQAGGFESKIFSKVSHRTIDIARKDYGKLPYTVNTAGIPSYKSSNGVYNEGRSTYSVQYKEKMILNTDLLSDAEYAWLEDLILSPMVYLEDAGYYYPVVITDNNYEPKKVINDDLTNLVINIEFGRQLNAQYR